LPVGQALLPVFAPQGATKGSPFGRMADKSVRPTAKRWFTFMVGQALLLPVFAPQGATKGSPEGRTSSPIGQPDIYFSKCDADHIFPPMLLYYSTRITEIAY